METSLNFNFVCKIIIFIKEQQKATNSSEKV
jgi:hypothetical protein